MEGRRPPELRVAFSVGELDVALELRGDLAWVTVSGAWAGADVPTLIDRLAEWPLPAHGLWDLRGSRLRFMNLSEVGLGAAPVIDAVHHRAGATALVCATDADVGLVRMWAALLAGAMPRRRYHVTTSMDDARSWLDAQRR